MFKPRNTRKYSTYPEIPDRIFRHSYPTRYPVYCPIPDPILKNSTRWALVGGGGWVKQTAKNRDSPTTMQATMVTAQARMTGKIVSFAKYW